MILKDIEQTRELGRKIAAWASPGTVIALIGDLGSGKTALTKAIAEGLGIDENVNSPTFTLVQEYRSGRVPMYHFDVYRIDTVCELDAIDFDEYFYGDGICVVEWANLIEDILPDDAVVICLKYGEKDGSRVVEITRGMESIDEYFSN